jgi:hypothetical protein
MRKRLTNIDEHALLGRQAEFWRAQLREIRGSRTSVTNLLAQLDLVHSWGESTDDLPADRSTLEQALRACDALEAIALAKLAEAEYDELQHHETR